MFFTKKPKQTDNDLNEEYEEAAGYAGGIGGFGTTLPKDKEGLKAGWWCPNCENIYSPQVTECTRCNEENEEHRKEELKRKENTKNRRHDDEGK